MNHVKNPHSYQESTSIKQIHISSTSETLSRSAIVLFIAIGGGSFRHNNPMPSHRLKFVYGFI